MEDTSTVERHAHVAPEALQGAAGRLDGISLHQAY
jgi:hypothetical protein